MPNPKEEGNSFTPETESTPWWSDMAKELFATGLSAFFVTEDSIRNYIKEKKLPKELVSLLLEAAKKKKDDAYAVLAKEFSRVLSKIDVAQELTNFLERHKIHVDAKFTFEPREKKDL